MKKIQNNIYASFRDPSGYVYEDKGIIYRKIFPCYFKQYDYFMSSGLYNELVNNNYIVSYKEIERCDEYILLKVDKIPFISYPYEWCFSQIKDAAILTLDILRISLKYGMILKDASGYNITFNKGRPIFIDTLSFDFYNEGSSWGAYGQFCRHFMSPLLLMSYVDIRSNLFLRDFIDGIPVDFADNILKGRGGMTYCMHIKWHAKSIIKYNNTTNLSNKSKKISKQSLVNMIDMIIRQINKLNLKKVNTEWDNYYSNTNYDDLSDKNKVNYVSKYLKDIKVKSSDIIIDLGSNDGKYSVVASKYCNLVISMDSDYNCVDRNYLNHNDRILPMVMDFTNPSSSIGFNCLERDSIISRCNAFCVMALAVMHHICISNNVSFDMLARFLSSLGEYLIIEYVPKDDSKVIKLLSTRKDIFDFYNIDNFEKVFGNYYKIINKNKIRNSKRILYLMKRISNE